MRRWRTLQQLRDDYKASGIDIGKPTPKRVDTRGCAGKVRHPTWKIARDVIAEIRATSGPPAAVRDPGAVSLQLVPVHSHRARRASHDEDSTLMATTKAERLELQAARESALIDELNRRFARELAEVLKLTTAEAKRLVRELRTKDGRLVATKANLGRVLALRRDLQRAIEESGFQALAEAASDAPLDELTRLVLRGNSIAQAAASLTKPDLSAIAAFKTVRFDELLQVGKDTAIRLARIILDGTLGLQRVDDLVDDVADTFDITERQARTLYDTALSIYSRQVDQLHTTGDAEELFYYAGPLDIRTRKFCRDRVGKVFTRTALETADNGQLPNPLLTGGGYNCRHQPKRVSKLDAELLELAKSGGRAAHVQEQLDALDQEAA